jgi:cytochrome c oxidase subunit 2
MTSEDVIHSFYVPAFRVKTDVLPGRYTVYWFEATQPGRYHLFCAEYCGTNHSGMGGWVEVMNPTDYDNWLSGNANQESPVAAGQKIFQSLGCASCHGAQGEGGRGPSFVGLWGSEVQLEGDGKVTANEEYIRNSILNPSQQIVAGYRNIMPTFKGQVNEEQMLLLITYIKSLSPSQTSATETNAPARSGNQNAGTAPPAATNANSTNEQRSNPVGSTPRANQNMPKQ